MLVDPALKGRALPPERFAVERGAVRRFALAIGDRDPRHLRGDVAPPTFPTTMRGGTAALGVDAARVLHAGEEYRYRRALLAGDELVLTRRVADVFERRGRAGAMTFVVVTAEARDAAGELVFESRTTIICR